MSVTYNRVDQYTNVHSKWCFKNYNDYTHTHNQQTNILLGRECDHWVASFLELHQQFLYKVVVLLELGSR